MPLPRLDSLPPLPTKEKEYDYSDDTLDLKDDYPEELPLYEYEYSYNEAEYDYNGNSHELTDDDFQEYYDENTVPEEEYIVPPKNKTKKSPKPISKLNKPKFDFKFPKIKLPKLGNISNNKKLLIGMSIGGVIILLGLLFLIMGLFRGNSDTSPKHSSNIKINIDYPYANVSSNEKITGIIQVLYEDRSTGKLYLCETASNDYNKTEKRVEFGCLNQNPNDDITIHKLKKSQFIEN